MRNPDSHKLSDWIRLTLDHVAFEDATDASELGYHRAGQNPELAARAVATMWMCAPSLIATATAECLKRYLMAQVQPSPAIADAICWAKDSAHTKLL